MDQVQPTSSNPTRLAVDIVSATKVYSDGTQALLPVDLQIKKGEFVSLLGPSGCGKSTLLKMIAGLTKPSSGSIQIGKGDAKKSKELQFNSALDPSTLPRLSFVFQSPTLMPWANVRANVRLPLDLAGIPKVVSNERVNDILTKVGLSDFANSRPRKLSGGMQMRVSIARGLITQPDILLMDEPFGALDEITRHKLDSDLLALWEKENLTVIFVTHSIHEAVFLSSRVIMMAPRPGRITNEFMIEAAYPRSQDFMLTSQFMKYARLLQESLQNASQPSW